jgi:hypothetical protein
MTPEAYIRIKESPQINELSNENKKLELQNRCKKL